MQNDVMIEGQSMSDLRKAAQQVLKTWDTEDWFDADALRAALAQPEPEPVAWVFQHEETGRTMCVDSQQVEWGFEKGNPRLKKIWPLYTTPPQRKPLTEEEIAALSEQHIFASRLTKFVRAIEKAHGIGSEE